MDELEAEAERRREEREAQRLEKLQEAKTLQEEDSQFLVCIFPLAAASLFN